LSATGTGIAPFRAMSHHLLNHSVPHQDIYLIFGAASSAMRYTGVSSMSWQSGCPAFTISYFFQGNARRPNHPDRICACHLREICKGKQEKDAAAALPPASFFLCGWKNMIDEAKRRIQMLGYDRLSIHQELYG